MHICMLRFVQAENNSYRLTYQLHNDIIVITWYNILRIV